MFQNSIGWSSQPAHARLFILYLVAVVLIAFVKSIKLLSRLYPVRHRRPISLQDICDGSVGVDLLIACALANRIRCFPMTQLPNQRQSPADREKNAFCIVESAERGFEYLWDVCHASAKSIKRLVPLTLLLSLLLVTYAAFPAFENNFNNLQVTGRIALYHALATLLNQLALGIAASAILYFLYSLFVGALMKRRASWKCFSARAKVELSPGE